MIATSSVHDHVVYLCVCMCASMCVCVSVHLYISVCVPVSKGAYLYTLVRVWSENQGLSEIHRMLISERSLGQPAPAPAETGQPASCPTDGDRAVPGCLQQAVKGAGTRGSWGAGLSPHSTCAGLSSPLPAAFPTGLGNGSCPSRGWGRTSGRKYFVLYKYVPGITREICTLKIIF